MWLSLTLFGIWKTASGGIKEWHQLLMRFLFFLFVSATFGFSSSYNPMFLQDYCPCYKTYSIKKKRDTVSWQCFLWLFLQNGWTWCSLSISHTRQTTRTFNSFCSLLSGKQASLVQQITAHFIFNSAADCSVSMVCYCLNTTSWFWLLRLPRTNHLRLCSVLSTKIISIIMTLLNRE